LALASDSLGAGREVRLRFSTLGGRAARTALVTNLILFWSRRGRRTCRFRASPNNTRQVRKMLAARQSLLVDLGDSWYKHASLGDATGLPGV
jgi:hypothetical protein